MACLSVITVFSMMIFCRGLCGNSIKCPRMQHNGCSSQRSDTSRPETINFGLMLSFRDPEGNGIFPSAFDDGHDIAPAVYLAVEQVNNRSDLLHDYRINISRFDGGCDVSVRTLLSVNELYCSCEPIVGIIGPSCDQSSMTVSHFTNRAEFSKVTINYEMKTYNKSSDRDYDVTQPYSFKIFGLGIRNVEAIADLIKRNNWNNSALLFTGDSTYDPYIERAREEIIKHTNLSGYQFRLTLPVYRKFYIPVKELQNHHIRVTVVLASSSTVLRLLCLAYHEGMMFPKYQWIFESKIDLDFHETSFAYNGSEYNCSESDISSSLYGSIYFFLDVLSDEDQSNTVTDAGVTYEEYDRAYSMQADKYSSEFGVQSQPKSWAKGFYDAVWVLAIALNDSLADLNMSLTEFKWGSRSLAERIRSHLLNVDYKGIIGGIKFHNETGVNREHNLTVSVYQYGQNLKSKRIAFYDGEFTFLSNTSESDIFIKAHFKMRYMHIDRLVAIILFVVTVFSLTITIFAHVVNIIYRKHKAIKSSSPALNNLVFLGCYLIVIGVTIDIVSHVKAVVENASEIRPSLCALFVWLVNIGTTLLFGTICAKTWRLHRIYTLGKELKTDVRFIQGYYLFGFVCILAIVDSFICLLWHLVSPFMLSRTEKIYSDTESEDPVLLVEETCQSSYTVYFLSILLLPKTLVTIASLYMALTTNINIREFKTSNIIILTYLMTILLVLGIPLYVLVSDSDDVISVRDIVSSMFLNITVCVCVVLLFLPLIEYVTCSALCVTLRVRTYMRSNEL